MKLYYMRHGQSEANAEGLISGDDPGLTEKGRQQASNAKSQLLELNPDVIYVSTMNRAKETAQIIAKSSKYEDKLIYEPRLVERAMGSASHMLSKDTGWVSSTVPDHVEGVEQVVDVFSRARDFLDEISNKYDSETILLICHGVIIKVLLSIHENLAWDEIKDTRLVQAKMFDSYEEGKK